MRTGHASGARLVDDGPADMEAGPRVSAVMPCLNEANSVAVCIAKAKAAFMKAGLAGEVIVADNGSTDRSVELALRAGARVIHVAERGYGAALRGGIAEARGDVIVMADSDDSYDWSLLGVFVAKIDEGYDLVMGNRFRGGIDDGAMPLLHRYLGNPVLSFLARRAFNVPVGDFHCGMRAFTRAAFDRMGLQSVGMEFATEMVAASARNGLRIGEIPVTLHRDRRSGTSHLRSFRDGWRHLRFIVSYAPDHLYLGPGGFALIAGLILQIALLRGPLDLGRLHLGVHFVALGGALCLLGLNVLLMGILAKTAVAERFPEHRSPLMHALASRFRLEAWLVAAGLVFVAGFIVDAILFGRWLLNYGTSMEDTLHAALVATNAIVFGVNLGFGAFLLHLMLPPRGRGS